MSALLASGSKIKLEVAKEFWPSIQPWPSTAELPAQPINSALACAHRRLDSLPAAELRVAIENGIDTISAEHFLDVCAVVVERNGVRTESLSFGIAVPKWAVRAADRATEPNFDRSLGYQFTAGEMLAKRFGVDHANWMADPRFGGIDRREQIRSAMAEPENAA